MARQVIAPRWPTSWPLAESDMLSARVRGKALHYGCAIPFVAVAAPSLSQLMHNRETGTGPVAVPSLDEEKEAEFDSAETGPAGRSPSAVKAVGSAVTGAVTAVIRGRDPAAAVTGSVPAVTAVAGRPSLSRRAGGPGLNRSPRRSRSLTKCSPARQKARAWPARPEPLRAECARSQPVLVVGSRLSASRSHAR